MTAGDRRLDEYTRQHANAVRDRLLASVKTVSVGRYFRAINAVVNWSIKEHALDFKNHFSGVHIPGLGQDSEAREEFTDDERKALVAACREIADDRRFIISMIADTGARLGEIVGLRVADVHLSAEVPHIHIHPYEGRTVKTPYSNRKVPLVGEALWAAQKAVEGKAPGGLLFPAYGPSKGNSASAALNKWVQEHLKIPKSMHCLRHSMQTRLRAKGVPEEIQVAIGGWTDGKRKISRGYGHYPLELLKEHLLKVVE